MTNKFLPVLLTLALGCHKASDDKPANTDSDTDSGQSTVPQCAAPPADAGALQAGIAKAMIPAPVGIGTAGFGPFGAPSSHTPFNDIYPGTKHIHGQPQIRAVVLSRGAGHEAIFVRIDGVGVFSQLRNDVVNIVKTKSGHDIDDALILGATHTHSGPGRVVNPGDGQSNKFYNFVADSFLPEFYQRFVGAIADTIIAAYDDLAPAEVGTAIADSPDAHDDRRCEDGLDQQDGHMPLIAVKRGGQVDALVFAYAVHGTILGIDELTMSRDAAGGIEEALEDRFDHPVMALFMNSWAADMSPGSPDIPHDPNAVDISGNYWRMRDVGEAAARAVDVMIPQLAWDDQPTLNLKTHRFEIHRDLLGYADDEWPYADGAVFCGQGLPDVCDMQGKVAGLDHSCIPFPAPTQTSTTVGQVGPYTLVTWPGEAATNVAQTLTQRIRLSDPNVGDFMFVGYAQDYLGYALLEYDWWKGGYEASGALWGPRQGQFISDRIVDAYTSWTLNECPSTEPAALQPFPLPAFTPYKAATPVDLGSVETEVLEDYALTDAVTWTLKGGDPWLGTPTVQLEHADGTPVTRPGGQPLTSDGYAFTISLAVSPDWPDEASERAFSWSFEMPVTEPVGGASLAAGAYQLHAWLPDGDGAPTEVVSAAFNVND